MKREDAYKELNTLDFAELMMRDIEKHRPENFGGDILDLLQLLQGQTLRNTGMEPEILKELHLNSMQEVEKRLESDSDPAGVQHFGNESYALAEKRKISIVKHARYSYQVYHDHEFFELAYLFYGSCRHTFRIGDEESLSARRNGAGVGGKEEVTWLGPGELVIIPPGMVHKVWTDEDSLMVNILIHRQTFQSAFLAQLPENNTLYRFFTDALISDRRPSYIVVRNNSGHLADLILDMYIEEKNHDTYSARMEEKILQLFFLELLRSNEKTMTLSANISEKDQLIAEILMFIENNYRTISLADVAERFHYSKAYLNRIFREKTEKTILQAIKGLRLAEAAKLLKDPTLSVEDVGEMVGYTDTSYFIEEYRKFYGKTPGQDRK